MKYPNDFPGRRRGDPKLTKAAREWLRGVDAEVRPAIAWWFTFKGHASVHKTRDEAMLQAIGVANGVTKKTKHTGTR